MRESEDAFLTRILAWDGANTRLHEWQPPVGANANPRTCGAMVSIILARSTIAECCNMQNSKNFCRNLLADRMHRMDWESIHLNI